MSDKPTWPHADSPRKPAVLVFGDVMLDRYVQGNSRTVSETAGPVIVSSGSESAIQEYPGGAANVAANILALGADCMLIGVTGYDLAADTLSRHARLSKGYNLLQVDPTRPTTVKTRLCVGQQILARLDIEKEESINRQVEEQAIAKLFMLSKPIDICVVSDYGKGAVTPLLLSAIRGYCQARAIPILVDPIGCDWGKYGKVKLFKSNLAEARRASRLAEHASIPKVLSYLFNRYSVPVAVTAGADGLWLKSRQEEVPIQIKGRPLESGRPPCIVGAGDTVIATVAVAMAYRHPLDEACRIGNVAASITVSRNNTGVITADELAGVMARTPQ